MIIVGDSAGGLLTLFVIALSRKEELRLLFNVLDPMLEIKGMVLISSMLEIGNRKDIIDYARTLVLQEKNHPAEAYIYEPSKLFGEIKFPPSFLVTSSEDFIRNDSLKIRSLLQASNTTFECLDWDKGKNYKLNHVFTVTYPTYQESQKTLDAMVSFLDQVC